MPLRLLCLGTALCEFIGEIHMNAMGETREARYQAQGKGCYMLQTGLNRASDPTERGNVARFFNNSCDPNVGLRRVTLKSSRAGGGKMLV